MNQNRKEQAMSINPNRQAVCSIEDAVLLQAKLKGLQSLPIAIQNYLAKRSK
jgi:hypothetical protein